jgi:hypothetical protein
VKTTTRNLLLTIGLVVLAVASGGVGRIAG